MLGIAADQFGITINALVNDLLERELEIISFSLEDHLSETVKALRHYRSEGAEEDWKGFARAEVEEEDPVQTRLVEVESADRYGLTDILA
jgi:hypothetical protein